jgi:hypothetical protein
MSVLADVAKLGLVVQHTCVATTRRYANDQADVVRRYVKSQVEAVHKIYTDRETSIKVLSKYHGHGIDRDILEKTWEGFLSEVVLPKKQYPSLEGIKTVLALLGETDAKARTAKPEAFADSRFIRELDQSGHHQHGGDEHEYPQARQALGQRCSTQLGEGTILRPSDSTRRAAPRKTLGMSAASPTFTSPS